MGSKKFGIFAVMAAAVCLLAGSALALSNDDAMGYFDCTKNGETFYLYIDDASYGDLRVTFNSDSDSNELFIGAGELEGKTLKAYDGDDYYVTLTFQNEDTVKVKAGKRVKEDIGTTLDGTYKRHYGK